MNLFSLCGVALCTAFMILVIKEIRQDGAQLLAVFLGILLFATVIAQIRCVVDYLRILINSVSGGHYVVLLKALGIVYLTAITREICTACGESAVSGYVEAVGKAEIIVLCLPLLKEITETALRYI